MRDEVEKLIVDWLKRDNENTTYLAHQICVLFGVVGRSEQLKAFLEWFDKPEKLLDHDELIRQYNEENPF